MILWRCLPWPLGNEENQPPSCNNEALWSIAHLGKGLFFIALSFVMKRGGKESITWVSLSFPFFWTFLESFPLLFELFQQVPHHGSRCGFGAKWAELHFGPNWWPKVIASCFLLPQIIGLDFFLGLSKPNSRLWAWSDIGWKNGPLQVANNNEEFLLLKKKKKRSFFFVK